MLVTTSDLSYFMRCRKWRPFGKNMPSSLLRVGDTKQSSADRLLLLMGVPVHCHREKQQGFTSLHSAVSHSVNEVGKHIYKWWLARWLYFRKRQPAFGRTIEQVIICRYVFQPHWHCEKQLSGAKRNPVASLCGNGLNLPLVAKAYQPSFAWCHWHGANRMDFSLYKNPLISIKVLVPNYKENLADECLLKGILSKVVWNQQQRYCLG